MRTGRIRHWLGKGWPTGLAHGPSGFLFVISVPSSLTQDPQTSSNFSLSCWPELIKNREAFKAMALFTETCGMQSTFFFHFQNKQLRVRNSAPHPPSPASHAFPPPGVSPPDPSTPQLHYHMTVGTPREAQFNLQPVSPRRWLFWSTFLGDHKCFRSDHPAFLFLPMTSHSINACPCFHQQSLCKLVLLSLAALVTLPFLSRFLKPSLPQITYVFRDHSTGHGMAL